MLVNKLEILKGRGRLLAKARDFFAQRGILEVDTPHLCKEVIVDSSIDLITTLFQGKEVYYLNASPELYMKQLLSCGLGDIYQLGHVFRDGELGQKHQPEFTLCEWYRIGFSYHQMIDETLDFIKTMVGEGIHTKISYRQAFLKYAKIDPFACSSEDLRTLLKNQGIDPMPTELREDLIMQTLVDLVEPHFAYPNYTILTHFPPDQASLARLTPHEGHLTAERFEIYFQGLELANGFHELSDPSEQLARFQHENQKRIASHKPPLPISNPFIESLCKLPPCSGVAVGFDRLLMLQFNTEHISDILPFAL